MKYIKTPYNFGEFNYAIHPYRGDLMEYSQEPKTLVLPKKVSDALSLCDNPYSLRIIERQYKLPEIESDVCRKLKRMHKTLMSLGNKRFYISLLYSKIRNSLFNNTEDAFSFIANCVKDQIERRNELCLQRCLLAIKTSRSFKESGVLFIGASLPTGNMHAWIIESNCNPDFQDREWIMYKPLLAFYY